MAQVLRRASCVLGSVSAVPIVVGALFGPWATLFDHTRIQHSFSGMDPGNHGWLVVSFGVVGAIAFAVYSRAPNVWIAALAVASGAAAIAVTVHDRHALDTEFSTIHISLVQALQTFVRIGWGLDLALVASVIMSFSAVVLAVTDRLVARSSASPATS